MEEIHLEDSEFVAVSVLVPKHLVGAVYRAVGDIVEGKFPASSLPSAPSDDRFQWWPKDHVVQLKQEVHNPTVLALLNLAAERAGEWVSFDEVHHKAGRSVRQAMGDLAGFTQLIKRHFKQNVEGWWPVDIRSGTPLGYRMPPEVARYWKEA